MARRRPGERHRKRQAHADALRRTLHSGGAKDEEEPPLHTPDTDGQRSVFEQHLERQLLEIYRCSATTTPIRALSLPRTRAPPINPSNLRQRSFAPLLRKANLPHIRFHDLRHTCATLLLGKGTHPKFVQELLGHATSSDNARHLLPRNAWHGRSDRARYAGRARTCAGHPLLKAAALVSGWCQKGPGGLPALIFTSAFYLQIRDFLKWACLDSNQGPLPYQLGRGFPAGFRPVWKLPLFGDSWNLRRLRFTAPFASVLTRLQYGCSTRRGVSAVCQRYPVMFATEGRMVHSILFQSSHPVASIFVNHVSER